MFEKLVFASKNKGKIREIKSLFSGLGIEIVSPPEGFDPVEDGNTFIDNAIIKGKEAIRLTGLPALADDSGLMVDALGGLPGVHSSRYASGDSERIQKLLGELQDVEDDRRQARFVCALVLVNVDGSVLYSAEGVCEGRIIRESRGDDGFGFDPVFFISELNCTLAQVPLEKKNLVSHRAKAFSKMIEWIRKNYYK